MMHSLWVVASSLDLGTLIVHALIGLLVVFGIILALVAKFYVWDYVIRPRWFLSFLPRPKRAGFIRGHVNEMLSEPGATITKWFGQLGHVYAVDGPFGTSRILIDDRVALHHILISEPYKFPKPGMSRRLLAALAGEGGVLVTEGETHRRQRKIMNPSFGAPHIKTLYPLFINKALQLRDHILDRFSDGLTTKAQIDMYDHAGRASLDVISSAGFGYETNAIDVGNNSELAGAFHELFGSQQKRSDWLPLLERVFPALKPLGFLLRRGKTTHERASERAMETMHRIGNQLIGEKKAAVLNSVSNVTGGNNTEKSAGALEASQMEGRDLLSVLVKANMAADLKPSQKMSDEEVMAQITTFLVAGNDTTANAISWAIYGLCQNLTSQEKLREEILQFDEDVPSYDALNTLPYLDAVVRETLRVFSPVMGTQRTAKEDCVIPLGKPVVDEDGKVRHELHVAKNTMIFIPIIHYNKKTEIWGADAGEFNPERWFKTDGDDAGLPEGVLEVPSLAFPTFLAGPRACIGWRFSYIEMKTILYSLVRVLKFELAVPIDDIEGLPRVVTRPRVKSRPEESWQLPVYVSLVTDTP